MFKELNKGKNSEVEKKISENWAKMNILEKTINNRKDNFILDNILIILIKIIILKYQ